MLPLMELEIGNFHAENAGESWEHVRGTQERVRKPKDSCASRGKTPINMSADLADCGHRYVKRVLLSLFHSPRISAVLCGLEVNAPEVECTELLVQLFAARSLFFLA